MENNPTKLKIKATLIVNPASGIGDPHERRKQIKKIATKLGWVGDYRETTLEKNAEHIAKEEIKKGIGHIVVCGGDGTIMEALGAVVRAKVLLGIVPLGTGNLLAKNLLLPLETEDALKIALLGNNKRIDVGRANGIYFSLIAGIGLDAEIMKGANRQLKDKFGLFAYVLTGLKSLQNRPGRYEIKLDTKKSFIVSAKTVMASNMGRVSKGIEVVPSTNPQSGSLQLGIVKAKTFSAWMSIFANVLFKRIDNSPHYDVHQAKKIEIKSLSGPRLFQCDGNYFPKTESISIDIYHKAVTVMVNPDEVSASSMHKKVLVFDFDGTLADSLDMVVRIYNSLAVKHGFSSITPSKRKQLQGLGATAVIAQLPISKLKLPFIYKEGKKEFEKNFEFIKPFNDLPQIVKALSKIYILGIVTSNDPINVKKFLLNHQMDYFEFVYSDGSLFGKGKIIKNLLHKYTYDPKNVMYIGDEVRDVDAARSAGVKIVSVSWGFNSKKVLRANNPDFLIDKPEQLLTSLTLPLRN